MGCTGSKQAAAPAAPTALEDLDGQIFLMVNGTSGGQASKQLLDLGTDEFEFTTKKGKQVKVWVFNLKDNDSRTKGFKTVAQECERVQNGGNSDIRVVACGGDGTVKWVISELSKVKCLHVPIGVIPFGTGNDFSRAMGWGASAPSPLVGKNMSALKDRMGMVFESKVGPLDTWLCDITVRDSGKFFEVKDGKIVETYVGQKTITHECINYISCGADAQIVFEFEQNRTTSQLGNKLVYVRKGTKQLVNRPKKLRKMIQAVTSEDGTPLQFRKRDRILAFLNIPSYSAGANIWRPGKGKYGSFSSQYVGDKRLEAVTVHTTTDVALHIATGSYLGIFRAAQQSGYDIEFKENASVYLQVDGEAIKAENIESIRIRHGYQVNVLRSPKAVARPYPPGALAADSSLAIQPTPSSQIVVEEKERPASEESDSEDEEEDDEDDMEPEQEPQEDQQDEERQLEGDSEKRQRAKSSKSNRTARTSIEIDMQSISEEIKQEE